VNSATQCMAVKCISEVLSSVKLQQLVWKSRPSSPNFHRGPTSAKFGVV